MNKRQTNAVDNLSSSAQSSFLIGKFVTNLRTVFRAYHFSVATLSLGVSVLSASAWANDKIDNALIESAKKEGQVISVGMPDTWANWQETWEELNTTYGLTHQDTDMSSAEEIAKFKAEGENASADIGDVGIAFGPIALQQGVTQAYKTPYWDEIPAWAKDEEGHWVLGYTGTIAFIIDNSLVQTPPTSWAELKASNYKVSVGDVGTAAQANNAVLAAAYALGGSETNIEPAINYFSELAQQKRLSLANADIAALEKGEIEVALMWDFNALNYRDKIDPNRFTVLIPSDGSIISGYATIINKHAKNPNAAKLARAYILSDEGQINLAKGYAKPIRESVVLPKEVQDKLLPSSQYENAKPIADNAAWEMTSKQIPALWQSNVLIHMQ